MRTLARLALLLAALPLAANERLGTIVFPNSGNPEAQRSFLRGVAALHSFWYEEAADAFREAQKADPDFLLAYWGEAMTYNHPIWMEVDVDRGRDALKRAASAKKATPRERAWIDAVSALYAETGDKDACDAEYERRMARLAAARPDDAEAQAFHALAILGLMRPGEADARKQIRAAAILEPLLGAHSDHPGVLHYMIHAYDDPIHAPLGLRAARRYAKVAPAAHHALHMPSHIFLQLGMWDEAAKSNEQSFAASKAWVERRGHAHDKHDLHSLGWLQYIYLQQHRLEEAKKLIAETMGDTSREKSARRRMAARYAVETGDGSVLSDGEGDELAFARGHRAVAAGDLDAAKRELAQLRGASAPSPAQSSMANSLEALIAFAEKRTDDALRLAREAVRAEEAMGAPSGPPDTLLPAHEISGELLLRSGRAKESLEQFRNSLLRTPNRARSLDGAMRAAEAAGDAEAAREYRSALAAIRRDARLKPALAEKTLRAFSPAPRPGDHRAREGVGEASTRSARVVARRRAEEARGEA